MKATGTATRKGSKITYTVTLEDGTIATRTSARTYTHAVVQQDARDLTRWVVVSYAGSLALAHKAAAANARYDYIEATAILVPLTPTEA